MGDRADLETVAKLVEVPPGCVPEYAVAIVSYLGEDGSQLFAFTTMGGANYSSLIGLLAMVSSSLVHQANPEGEGEDEDEDADYENGEEG